MMRRDILALQAQQALKLVRGTRHGVINNDVVELVNGVHLHARGGQAPLLLMGVLRAAPCQPGWGECAETRRRPVEPMRRASAAR